MISKHCQSTYHDILTTKVGPTGCRFSQISTIQYNNFICISRKYLVPACLLQKCTADSSSFELSEFDIPGFYCSFCLKPSTETLPPNAIDKKKTPQIIYSFYTSPSGMLSETAGETTAGDNRHVKTQKTTTTINSCFPSAWN